ncbi:MAG: TPM domain-containing protein [Lentisphaeria bacterium]|nr:TPM domain-containing protein [Lentisphaeria bacterium]
MPNDDIEVKPDAGKPVDREPDTHLKFRLPRLGCFSLFFLFFLVTAWLLFLLFTTMFEPPIDYEMPTERVTVSDPCNVLREEDREILTQLANEVADLGGCSVAVLFVDERFADFRNLFDAVLAEWAPGKGVLVMCGMEKAETYSYNTNLKMALVGGEWRLAGSNVERSRWKIQNETAFNKGNAVFLLLTDLKQSLERAKADDLPEGVLNDYSGVYFESESIEESGGFRYTSAVISIVLGVLGILFGLLIWSIGRSKRKNCLANWQDIRAEYERRRPNEPELELRDRNESNEKKGKFGCLHHPLLKAAGILFGTSLAALCIIGGIYLTDVRQDFASINETCRSVDLEADELREAPDGLVVDLADAFTPDEERILAETVDHLEKTVGGQVRILTIKTLGSNVLEDYTLEVASNWGIGEAGKDNGALLFLAIDDRRNRIEVGYGWEGTLTDARCGDLLREVVPDLRAEHYADACVKIVQRMEQYLSGNPVFDPDIGFAQRGVVFVIPSIEPPVPAHDPREPDFLSAFLGIFGILLAMLGVGLGYLGRIYSTSQPDYYIFDPVKFREELAKIRSSYRSSGSSSGHRSSSHRSGGSHRSSGGSHRSGGGGRFGGGGASGRW